MLLFVSRGAEPTPDAGGARAELRLSGARRGKVESRGEKESRVSLRYTRLASRIWRLGQLTLIPESRARRARARARADLSALSLSFQERPLYRGQSEEDRNTGQI